MAPFAKTAPRIPAKPTPHSSLQGYFATAMRSLRGPLPKAGRQFGGRRIAFNRVVEQHQLQRGVRPRHCVATPFPPVTFRAPPPDHALVVVRDAILFSST